MRNILLLKNKCTKLLNRHPYMEAAAVCMIMPAVILAAVFISATVIMFPISFFNGWF